MVHRVAKSQTQLKQLSTHASTDRLSSFMVKHGEWVDMEGRILNLNFETLVWKWALCSVIQRHYIVGITCWEL